MKLKTNYFSLLFLFVIIFSGFAMAQVPANNSTGISATTSFTFAGATTLAGERFQISTNTGFTGIVLDKNLGAIGATGYTFSGGDLTGVLAGHTQFDNNTVYHWRIVDNAGSTVEEPLTGWYTFTTVLGAPTADAATSVTSSGFTANWTANVQGGATGYILRVGTTSGGTDIVNDVNVGNILTYPISGLIANTHYYYSVKATDGANTTSASSEITAITLLGPPTATAASLMAPTSFTANWTANPTGGATAYLLSVGTTPGGTDVMSDANVGNVLSYSVTGLLASTTYYYSVKAFDGINASASSNEITTATTAPTNVPLIAPVNGLTGVSVLPTFGWSDIFNETTFTVKISTDSAAFDSHVIATKITAQNATSWATADTLSGLPLSNGTKYYWQVSVQGGSSDGLTSSIYHFTTTQNFTLTLSTPKDSDIVYTSPAVFSWYLNTPISGMRFIVQYKQSTTPPADYTFWKDAISLAPTTNLSDSISVIYGKTYFWRVIAQRSTAPYDVLYDRNEYYKFSVAGGSSVILYPSWPLGGSVIYTNTPQLSWYPSQYSAGLTYQVRYSTANTVDSTGMLSDVSAVSYPTDVNILTATSNLYVTTPALTPGTHYYWQVRAYYDSTGLYSNWSTVESFVTNGPGTVVIPVTSYPIVGETVYTTNPTLYWYLNTASSGLYYDVDLSIDSTFASHIVGYPVTTLVADQMSYDATGLVPGQTYFWRVRSNNLTTTSAWSESTPVTNGKFTVAGGTTSHPVASWPIGVTTPIVYTPQPTLNWYQEGSGLGITQYVVKYIKGSAPSDWTSYSPGTNTNNGGVYTVSPTTFSVQDTTNLTYGATYYWAVASYNGSAYSTWSQGSFTVVGGSAGAAIVLSQPGNGATVYNTKDTLSWYINGSTLGLLSYTLQYSQSDQYTPLVGNITGLTNQYYYVTGLN
ncbi:MAG: fibronectin type III domain-containing protein, partial [Ignavibacteriaceae bacterium]|nr:fibronectin type III domain-containing protein [Ignavibacteriaceae bacterium]